jgi:hypothetical protein
MRCAHRLARGIEPLHVVAALQQIEHRQARAAGQLEGGRTAALEEGRVVVGAGDVTEQGLLEIGDQPRVELRR